MPCIAVSESISAPAPACASGERVYFCTRACLRVFEQDPDPFIAGEIEHPIDEE